jgi:type II secretion system protein D
MIRCLPEQEKSTNHHQTARFTYKKMSRLKANQINSLHARGPDGASSYQKKERSMGAAGFGSYEPNYLQPSCFASMLRAAWLVCVVGGLSGWGWVSSSQALQISDSSPKFSNPPLAYQGKSELSWQMEGSAWERPVPPVTHHGSADDQPFDRFRLQYVTASVAEAHLRQRLGDRTNYRILIDSQSQSELVLYAPAELLNHCRSLIGELDRPPAHSSFGSASNAGASNLALPNGLESPATGGPSDPTGWQQLKLERLSLEELNQSMDRFPALRSSQVRLPSGMMYELVTSNGRTLKLGWDWNDPVLNLGGSVRLMQQFAQLVQALETARQKQLSSEVVGYQQASPVTVNRLVSAWTSTGSTSQPPVAPNQPLAQDGVANQLPEIFQQDGESLPQDQIERLRQLNESIQVETLPDLGVIILRGRQNEVQELSRILKELERLSAETQPEVQVIPLQHTQSDAMESIIRATSADLISGRVGRVSITSLVKPNALLLIGWGDAVKAITDLISKLDQPVSPGTQFEVFRLQHALANEAQASLNTFFQNRSGLGVRIQAIADTRTNSLVVYSAPRDRAEVRQLVSQLDVPGFQRKRQARVIKVNNAIASELAITLQNAIQASAAAGPQGGVPFWELLGENVSEDRLLKAGNLEDVRITPNPMNNTLVVTGAEGSIELLESLIQQLDVAGATAQIKVFRIEYGDAATLVQMLRSLLPEQSIDRPALKIPSETAEASLAPLRFSVDTRTNSIIATGSEGDLRIIHALLMRLDEKEFSQRQNMVYRLKNAPATDVAIAINNFLRSERIVQQIGGGSVSPFEQLEREVIVVPEPIGNRLILSATPRFFNEVESLITQLDEPPPQVMIQVMIAEITLNDGQEFGIEIGLQDSVLFDRSLLGNLVTTTETSQVSTPSGIVTTTEQIIQAASNTPGFDFNNQPLGNSGSNRALAQSNIVGTQGLSNFSIGRVNSELGFGGLVFSASSQSVSVLMRALQESRRLEILSRPQIRTLDNQPAFIQVGQRVPRIVGSTVNQAGQSNSVVLENVGLILGVTPRISPDGTVVMEVDAERSGLGPEAEGVPVSVSPTGEIIRSPRVDTTTAQATVSAASGETIILGGLITKQTATLERKVPRLGDIPVLGRLFRFDSQFVKRTELLIILTPYVIRNRNDELALQQAEFAKMSWCLGDVEQIHGRLDGILSAEMFDYDSSETLQFLPGQSPLFETLDSPEIVTPKLPTPIPASEADWREQ